jgi:mono/diheme cytochrome c family protein
VPPEVWKRASVGSAANCGACHGNAAQGNFSEREIKIPK